MHKEEIVRGENRDQIANLKMGENGVKALERWALQWVYGIWSSHSLHFPHSASD